MEEEGALEGLLLTEVSDDDCVAEKNKRRVTFKHIQTAEKSQTYRRERRLLEGAQWVWTGETFQSLMVLEDRLSQFLLQGAKRHFEGLPREAPESNRK